MNPGLALELVQWALIVGLFLAVGSLYRQLQLMRAMSADHGYVTEAPDIQLGAAFRGAPRVVLASDSGCPLCGEVGAVVAHEAAAAGIRPTLLTYQGSDEWPSDYADHFEIVTDSDAWTEIAHLTPPILLSVAADGSVLDLTLPGSPDEAAVTFRNFASAVSSAVKENHHV